MSSASYALRVAIRVVLAEDNYLVREGLRRLLETRPEVEVVASVRQPRVAPRRGRGARHRTSSSPTSGCLRRGSTRASRRRGSCGRARPGVGVVVLSQYTEPGYALALLEDGSEGRAYLLKERIEDVDELVAAITAVAGGGSVIDPKVVETLVATRAHAEESSLHDLTPRELDVLREMAEGKNNAAIAGTLFLSTRSVEKVIHSIFLKLGLAWEDSAHKRVKAVIMYLGEQG